MWYRQGNQTTYLALSGGFAEVLPDRVTVLTRDRGTADEIDVARAEAAKKRAEDRIAAQYPDIDYERARLALFKALMRLQVATRVRVRV
jgi:F-type H+-transporting ATPase subunit epsilon